MNRLSGKFIIGISVILCFSCICTIFFHLGFLEKYYLYRKKNSLSVICENVYGEVIQGADPEETMTETENTSKVIIVKIDQFQDKENDRINDEIRAAFQENGIGFQKYWLWEKDYLKIQKGEICRRLYEQEKLNYSLLVEYRKIGSSLYIFTMIIPDIADAFGIINTFLIVVNGISLVISVVLIIILIRRIVRPLTDIRNFASQMEQNRFLPLEIHTGDELEEVAVSLNRMGSRIMEYQDSLHEKNQQMEQLLDNVAHELKTPLSLIKLYAEGMKDGLDDGTFTDTILEENRRMAEMTDRLLYLSRINKKEYRKTRFNLSACCRQLADQYSMMAEKNHQRICVCSEKDLMITASEELVRSLLTNLITNAVKYSSGREIRIEGLKKEGRTEVLIINETDNQALELSRIWDPYYVGEKSRNKEMSGTGLGLSIVRKICETQNYEAECFLEQERIVFRICIPDAE